MRKTIIAFLALVSLTAGAQTSNQSSDCIYRVTLADKHGTRFSTDKPQAFLSPKAIERRRKQGIAVDSTDLPVPAAYVDKVRKKGARIIGQSKWNNTLLVRSADTTIVGRLLALDCVSAVRRVWRKPLKQEKSDDPQLADYWNDWRTYKDSLYGAGTHQIEMLGGQKLHAAGFRGQGMTVAILDAGFLNVDKIPAFRNTKIIGVRNFVATDSLDPYRLQEHGTMTLSCLGTNVVNQFVGTAPEADYWLLRTEDYAGENMVEEDYWAMAAEFADSVGVDVLSSSLGYHAYDDPSASYRYRDQDGQTALITRTAAMLVRKGIVHVNSAGNEGKKAWKKINFPADSPTSLAVGALTPEGENALFSSVGPSADGRVKPDVMAQGNPTAVIDGAGSLTESSGTSFACPTLAGLVVCLWQALPQKKALEIVDIVRRAGNNYATPDNIFGYGIPDFWRAYEANR